MGANSKISWTDATFNPWWGCARVSPACEHCYAESFDKRVGRADWGVSAPRRFFGDKHWNEPLKWNREALDAGVRRRVFCASMADVFEDRRDLDTHRMRLWELINVTRGLDWLLLTKRPENVSRLVPDDWESMRHPPANVWLGATVEDNKRLTRIPHLLAAKWPVVRFLSMEPLFEEVRLDENELGSVGHLAETFGNPLIHWVITGYESGHHRRPTDEDWIRSLRDQCNRTGAAFFFKQRVTASGVKIERPDLDGRTWSEFPQPQPSRVSQ